ncbi:unnamed protein product [Penicillium viridicatum]
MDPQSNQEDRLPYDPPVYTTYGRAAFRTDGHQKRARPQGSHPDLIHFKCNFYAILDRFLPYGPVSEKKGDSGTPYEDRVITVENLVIDFRSAERNLPFPPRDMGYRDWLAHIANTWHGDQRVDKAPKYETRPKWPLYLLRSWLKSTIGMGYGTAEFGAIIYERIGTIFMMVNGRLETTLDLADGLAKLLVQSPPDTVDYAFWGVGADEFHMWRKTTLLKRQALGFPVVWPQDLESE